MNRIWRVRDASLRGDGIPLLVGIVNATPDSFFDGGRHGTPEAAYAHGMRLAEEGADLLDVGGESTRPGATPADSAEERRRIEPVVTSLVAQGVRVCIDTRHADVARAALDRGACAINDVSGLADPTMLALCREFSCGACAMHMRGTPASMQSDTAYADLESEVAGFLTGIVERWAQARLPAESLALDPGVGFGKSATQNHHLVGATARFRQKFPAHPWYLGLSRKSWIAPLAAKNSDRLAGSLGGALAAAQAGCDILRVHDVAQTREAIRAFQACRERS